MRRIFRVNMILIDVKHWETFYTRCISFANHSTETTGE